MGRVGLGVALAVVVSVLAAGTAVAGGGASVRVGRVTTFCGVKAHNCTESPTIYQNDSFTAPVTGHAPRGGNFVAGFDGPITCKAKYKAEYRAYKLEVEENGGDSVSPGKKFKEVYQSMADGPTDTICVYVIHLSTGKTFAHASKKFAVLPQPTP
jgi:hypothetical protein